MLTVTVMSPAAVGIGVWATAVDLLGHAACPFGIGMRQHDGELATEPTEQVVSAAFRHRSR